MRCWLGLTMALLAGLAGAATQDAKPPAPSLPVKAVEFAGLLNWVTHADATAREAFPNDASAALGKSGSAKGKVQLALLKQVGHEAQGLPEEAANGYAAIAKETRFPEFAYAATAAFRGLQFALQTGNSDLARDLHPLAVGSLYDMEERFLWIRRGDTWRLDQVADRRLWGLVKSRLGQRDEAAEEAPLLLNAPHLRVADFAGLLNWVTLAEATASEAILKDASDSTKGGGPEVYGQIRLLQQISREGLCRPIEAANAYAALIETEKRLIPPTYAATAAFRAAQLAEQAGDTAWATELLALARQRNYGGFLWVRQGDTWRPDQVDEVTGGEFLRLNQGRLTYRFTVLLAGYASLAGLPGYLVFLLMFFGTLRFLQIPLFMMALREIDLWAMGRPARWRYILAWLAIEYIPDLWVKESMATWAFVFDFPGFRFLRWDRLDGADIALVLGMLATALYAGATFCATLFESSWEGSLTKWPARLRSALVRSSEDGRARVLIPTFVFALGNMIEMASGGAASHCALATKGLTGLVTVVGCRLVLRFQSKAGRP